MSRALFIFTVSFLFHFFATAQQIKWSAPLNKENKLPYLKILGSDQENFYLLQSSIPLGSGKEKPGSKSRRYMLSCYSMNMILRWEKTLAPPVNDGKITDIRIVNSRVLVAACSYSRNKMVNLYLQYIDASGNYEGVSSKVDSFNTQKLNSDYNPSLIVSKDESWIGLGFQQLFDNESRQLYRITVADTLLAKKFMAEIHVDTGEKYFNLMDVSISNSGNVFLLGSKHAATRKIKNPDENYYRLYTYLHAQNKTLLNNIRSEEKFLTDIGLVVDNLNNAAVVSGFYSDKTTYSMAGVFYFALRPEEEGTPVLRTTAFSEEFLKKFFTERRLSDSQELMNYSIDRILLRKDGGAVLAAESYRTFSQSYYDYYTQMLISHTYYNYGNIIVLSVNPDGRLLWNEVLKKEQNSTDDDGTYSSYCLVQYGSKMYFIYNKYIESKTSVLLSYVTITGEQNTLVLFNELENILALPKAGLQVEQDVLLLPAYKENELRIAKISF